MKYLVLLIIALIILSGCVIPSYGGVLQLKITDKAENVTSLILNIDEIRVHQAIANETGQTEGEETNETDVSGWITVLGAKTIDLITVKDVKELLGETSLSEGKYTQIRISVSGATATIDGVTETLTVPSKNIKFVHPFEIENNKTTSLVIDFDADKSIVKAGNKYILKPVVRISTEFTGKEKGEAERIKNQQATERRS